MKQSFFLFITLFCFLVSTGCKNDQKTEIKSDLNKANVTSNVKETTSSQQESIEPSVIIVKVNNSAITGKDLLEEIQMLLQQQNIPPNQRNQLSKLFEKQALDNLITRKLLIQKAEKEGLIPEEKAIEEEFQKIVSKFPSEEDFLKQLTAMGSSKEHLKDAIRSNLQIDLLLNKEVPIPDDPKEDEINKYYTDHKDRFSKPEEVHARHILVKIESNDDEQTRKQKLEKIKKLKKMIEDGTDFAEIAKKESDCPSRSKGGDLGYFRRGQMVKPFEDAAFTCKVGDITGPVETRFGYHLIQVLDHKESQMVPLETVKDQIIYMIKTEKRSAKLRELINQLREAASIEYLDTKFRPDTSESKKLNGSETSS